MQAYGKGFAAVYNRKWSGFAKQVAPRIHEFYCSTPTGDSNKTVLDLCCGAGHLSRYFLDNGYRVVGIDLSEDMLCFARENAGEYVNSGKCTFIHADASSFTLDERFRIVVSTYDSLNHLEDERSLSRCFQCVRTVCDGYFVFDLNTRLGLQRWHNTRVDDSEEDLMIINRGKFDGDNDRAWMTITGFVRQPDGLYKRFDETVYNTVFNLKRVKEALIATGWNNVYFATIDDLSTAVSDPEDHGRIFVVASD